MRTVIINYLGVQYVGLNSLFSSILSVLNLAELGVGSAMVYCMYRPIASDNENEICALMKLYRNYYRLIGFVVAILGLLLLPFLPKFVTGEVPDGLNLYTLYILNLITTVLSYWLFAYKNCLLNAHQRIDVISKVNLVVFTIQYVLQFISVCFYKNYYLFFIISLICQILTNIITAIIVSYIYPHYKPMGKLRSDNVNKINKRIKDLFTAKIGGVVLNSADSIVISSFMGLAVLAVYQNYFYIINAIITTISIVFNSCTAGIGNSLIVESKEKNFNDLSKFTLLIVWITGFSVCCLLCLFQPFINLWLGEDFLLDYNVVVCLCIYFYVYEINQLFNLYKDAAGLWHEDRFRPLITSVVNVVLNVWLVNYLGIYGVIFSTVVATLFVGMPWLVHNLFFVIFEKDYIFSYLKKLIYYTIVVIISCFCSISVCCIIDINNNIYELIIRTFICIIIPNLMFFLCFKNKKEFIECIQIIDRVTKNRFNFYQKIVK